MAILAGEIMADKLLRLFTDDLEKALTNMGYENAGILFTALVYKNNGHEIPEIPGELSLVWDILLDKIARTEEYLQKKREAGRMGGLAKSSSAKQTVANLPSLPVLSLPVPSKSKKKEKQPVCVDPDFDRFWETYPKKAGKLSARKAWDRAKKNGLPDIETLIETVSFWKTREKWTKDNGQYIPHPATWLNAGRWDDDQTNEPEDWDIRSRRVMNGLRSKK
jgi:hypothetical protein